MKIYLIACAALIVGLTGCNSAPVHYHTLVPAAPERAVQSPRPPFVLDVLPVTVPAQLNQASLVVRRDDTTVDIVDTERWASPFASEIRSALSAELTQQLGTYDVNGLASTPGAAVVRLKLQIRRFDARPNGPVQLDADWLLTFPSTFDQTLTCTARLAAGAPNDYAGLVRAQQSLIHRLAGEIGKDIDAKQGGPVQCPNPMATVRR
ncbi:hypothetical protein R69927_07431 [Paraburkholderia domus]|uniref:PqiC family protein n=1 Tax=Paraburkholderia domus TaxID=2793075 RepID=UPI0019139B28|nr:PqiC family protein [Paraburkholderia domus]MBK5091421.1 membrane integrity-associated transporter subunit PqiC [Burkholderia sp. R-69927]CAE6936091.1 hypothetical protein R69927_07431 [Paraburkholderia domus]